MKYVMLAGVLATGLGVFAGGVVGRMASPTPAAMEPPAQALPDVRALSKQPTRLRLPPTRDCLPEESGAREVALESRRKELTQELSLTRGFRDREYGTAVKLPSVQFAEPAVSAFVTDLSTFGETAIECERYPCRARIELDVPETFDALSARIAETYPDAVVRRGNTEEGDVSAMVQFAGAPATPAEARRLSVLMNLPMGGL